jgi:phytanoyl-CoA hydroxylase
MRAHTLGYLNPVLGPAEFEADLGYPGAPADPGEPGGETPRRLLHAYSRDKVFRHWATGQLVGDHLRRLFGRQDVYLSQCHHNCIMTKHPRHSSATLWHQDIRYWSFDRPELISVWLALGRETTDNGALQVIPGSHKMDVEQGRLDSALFLRTDLEENQVMIGQAKPLELEPGDVLFFHCRSFHAAGMNLTDELKMSLVFTYHTGDNKPISRTRSARLPGILLG